MEEDWHEAAFASKHIPHRLAKSHTKRTSFDVRKLFGRYETKCPATSATSGETSKPSRGKLQEPTIEIFRLSEDGNGVLGQIILPGALEAEIVLSGSRDTLNAVISKLEGSTPPSPDPGTEGQDTLATSRSPFEKNSFRAPKFWLRYKSTSDPNDTGTGYLVFSGNDCLRFKGTLSSERRGWDNTALSGWKAAGFSERDVPFHWSSLDKNLCRQHSNGIQQQVESSS